jgi:hypothetical protein
MRRVRVFSSALGLLVAGTACATSAAVSGGSDLSVPQQAVSRALSATERDSVIAQAVADREGPRVSVTTYLNTFSSSRRVRANFRVDDDAYVVVGHVGPDGVVRVVFPEDPKDDGFVKGDHTYQTTEFFGGFSQDYRFRAQNALFRPYDVHRDSYDGTGLGYVFVIASWRPMRVDQFASEGTWDSFELTDDAYLRDPRPAIQELASLLAGENREAYTVKYARAFNTVDNSGYGARNAYGVGFCNGSQAFGFGASPFAFGAMGYSESLFDDNYSFWRRGSQYVYDGLSDCYRPSFPRLTTPFQTTALGFATPPAVGRPRAFDAGFRSPPVPQGFTPRVPVTDGAQTPAKSGQQRQFSPEYRQRGLITTDDGAATPRRGARVDGGRAVAGEDRTRPSLQDMTNRRAQDANEGTIGARRRTFDNGSDATRGDAPTAQPRRQFDPNASTERREPRPEVPVRVASPPPTPPSPPPAAKAPDGGPAVKPPAR